MKKHIFFAFLYVLSVFCLFSCQNKEEENLESKAKKSIAESLKKDSEPFDSIAIVGIDSLSRYDYAALMLAEVEGMKDEYVREYLMNSEQMTDSAQREMQLLIEEIQASEDFFRTKYENPAPADTAFFLFLIEAKIFQPNATSSYLYIMTPDFVLHDDPFSENLLE